MLPGECDDGEVTIRGRGLFRRTPLIELTEDGVVLEGHDVVAWAELDDAGVLAVLSKEVKQRRDSIEEFRKGGREDLVKQNEEEIAILMEYLPQQLSEDEVRSLVKEAVTASGASSPKDMGKVMKLLMPKVKGRADGKLVNDLVRGMLQ